MQEEDERPGSPPSELPTIDGTSPKRGLPAFSPDELIAGRFRIVRFLARGGMGEVYETEDLELRENVALKTVRPEIAADERAMQRFRREVQLARKVTHPNVCRIYDVFRHREVAFLTMELLRGNTLTQTLGKDKMSTAQALPLVTQMADALSAAHKAGIVHRDFKSPNVVLAGDRVVVTDFGLARPTESADSMLSGTGEVFGTPAYMAPEQIEGGDITPATDVYALGVVMYEMVTGKLPFTGDSPMSVALKRLKETAPSPRTIVPDLDPKWESVILRCLKKKPEDRFASVADVARSLSGETLTSPLKWIRMGLTAALLFLLLAILGYELRKKPQQLPVQTSSIVPAPKVKVRPAVAVLGFKNLSGKQETAWLSTALSETISSELAVDEKVRTISGENVARLKSDLSLPEANSLAKETLELIRTRSGTKYVVSGSFLTLEGKIRLDLWMQDTESEETISPVTEYGTEAQLLDLVARMGTRLREKLGAGKLTEVQQEAVKASASTNPEAMRYYAEGLARLRVYDGLAARDLLQKAVDADPQFALAHSALSEAWSRLGYETKAREEIKKASELSQNLTREQNLLIEALSHLSNYEKDQAAKNLEALWKVFPDNIDYGLRLSAIQRDAYKPKEALITIDQMRKLPAPLSEDARIDLQEELTLMAIPDYKQAEIAAQKTIAKAKQQRAALIEAEARSNQSRILGWLDRSSEAIAAVEQAREIYMRAGDHANEAWTLLERANLKQETDVKVLNQALALYQQIGNKAGVARALQSIARFTELYEGDFRKAAAMYEKPLAMYREIGDQVGLQSVLYDMGRVYDSLESGTGRKYFEECFAINRKIGSKKGIAVSQFVLALYHLEKGELDSAKKNFTELIPLYQEMGNKAFENTMRTDLGWISILEGNLAEAHKQFDQVIGKGKITDTSNILAPYFYAVLLMEEGNTGQAEELARELVAHPRLETGKPYALQLLARTLLLQGKTSEAKKAIEKAALFLSKQNDETRADIEITAARVLAASGKAEDIAKAIKSLKSVVIEVTKAGLVYQEFEARLAIGEIEMRSGDILRGRADLVALQKDADAKGFGLISAKARKLL